MLHKRESMSPKHQLPSSSDYPRPSLGSARAKAWVQEGDLVVTLKLIGGGSEETKTYARLLGKWVHGLAWSTRSRCGVLCCSVYGAWHGMVWHGMVWYGKVRLDVVW